jgi:tetratricopeptide (TPR) repeat protein
MIFEAVFAFSMRSVYYLYKWRRADMKFCIALRCFTAMALLFAASGLVGQESRLSLVLVPGAEVPFGPKDDDGNKVYTFGGSASLRGEYSFSSIPFLYVQGSVGYGAISTAEQTSLSLISAGGGAGVKLLLGEKSDLRLETLGGYSIGIYKGSVAANPFFSMGTRFSFRLSPAFSLGLNAHYSHHVYLYNGLSLGLGGVFALGAGSARSMIEFGEIKLHPVFPVFYKFYDENPMGSIIIKNNEKGTIKDITLKFLVEEYMVNPKEFANIREMRKDQKVEIPVYALFTDEILEVTEDTKVSSQFIVEYSYLDEVKTGSYTETLRVYHRNAMTWDDDRKAASFVTAKDPAILQFSKQVAGEVRNTGATAVNHKFREAMGIFNALRIYGINYVIDPASSYAELSEAEASLDYLQFPVQTLNYRAGDCDDLSILYSALLESVGIETAFVTAPGHIYMAFNLDMDPEEAEKLFKYPEDLIISEGKTWLPVEITMIKDGFLNAWQNGAEEWRKYSPAGNAALFPVHQAWSVYEAVGIQDSGAAPQVPGREEIAAAYLTEMESFIDREIGDRVKSFEKKIGRSNNPSKLLNQLGLLYARFGVYDSAETAFREAADLEYVPAILNLGNIYYLDQDYENALDQYRRAEEISPENVKVLVGIAKANYELEDESGLRAAYNRIEEFSPSLAADLAYLVSKVDSEGRASEAQQVGFEYLLWEEEE